MAEETKTKERKTTICVFEVDEKGLLKIVSEGFESSTEAKKWLTANAVEGKSYKYGSISKGDPIQVVTEVKKKIM